MPSKARAEAHPEIGTELVREWRPAGRPKANIVLVHGLAEHSGRYERVGEHFAGAGFGVRSFDLRGAGGSGGRRWHIDSYDEYHEQVQRHVEWARGEELPVVLMGHSLGGLIAIGYLVSDRPSPDLAVLSAPALAGGAAWQRVVVPILAKIAPRTVLPNPVKGEHLCSDPNVAEAYFADPLVVTKSTLGFGAATFAELERLNRELSNIEVPTFVFHGAHDVLVPTGSSEPLESVPGVEREVYEGLRHETFNEPEGHEVLDDVVAWLDGKLSSS